MTKKLVDVFDRSGGKLFTYSIALEDVDCLDGEFEEVALIFAESSGLVATEEVVYLRARCEPCETIEHSAAEEAPRRTARAKNTVLSMVKHRMKKAAAAGHAARVRHVS
jgi:hypothetical protein